MLMGAFWRSAWSWASIVVFLAIVVLMTRIGTMPMVDLRRAAGLPTVVRKGFGPPRWMEAEAMDPAAIEVALTRVKPGLLTAVGPGGFLVLLWLMMFKPL